MQVVSVDHHRGARVGAFAQLTAQVMSGVGIVVGIAVALDVVLRIFSDGDQPHHRVVSIVPLLAALVVALQHFIGQTGQIDAPAGVDAVDFQWFAVQTVGGGQTGRGSRGSYCSITRPLRS
jgi:hypothetical protein